jgi:hypothetical protein
VTGSLQWNANGTLQQLQITDGTDADNNQRCAYGYDDLARFSNANCGANWGQGERGLPELRELFSNHQGLGVCCSHAEAHGGVSFRQAPGQTGTSTISKSQAGEKGGKGVRLI